MSVLLGYGPMLPFLLGAMAAWLFVGAWRADAIALTAVWGASILAFLSGVRRGLSFRTEGGPALMQIATMFGLFTLALTATTAIAFGAILAAVVCLFAGFGSVLILDPIAARTGQAPLFFARLRPRQMAIAVVGLGVILANLLIS